MNNKKELPNTIKIADIRSPICTVLGHVDHGKSSLLDYIRQSAITKTEPGQITQAIGASIIPIATIQRICGDILKNVKMDFTIPGLLFIDTPGHAAFTSLRKRGGSLADIAVLVIDVNEGIMPQTQESVQILKQSKTPFVIAANKIDLIKGWKELDMPLIATINAQQDEIKAEIDKRVYNIVGQLYEKEGLSSDRFDRVDDYTKNIAIVPTSAKTGKGIPELLMVITGLAQKYLGQSLKIETAGPAKGTILEIKEEKGIGKFGDAIIYDGTLNKNDMIVIGGIDKAIVTKIKALFEPAPLSEMRDKKTKFKPTQPVKAAIGVRIVAPGIEDAIAGMPFIATTEKDVEMTSEKIQKEVSEILIETDQKGIMVKADSIGSLEALTKILRDKNIPIEKAGIGNISKKDIAEAECMFEEDPTLCAILGFNVIDESKSHTEKVRIITNNVIYKLIEDYEKWKVEQEKKADLSDFEKISPPAKILLLRGYVFRQCNPAIIGAEIIEGKLKTQANLMNKGGATVGIIKSIQQEKKNLTLAEKGKQVAVSIEGPTVGRQIMEGETLYSVVSEEEYRKLKELKKNLSKDEIQLLKEIAEIMRKQNPTWGI